MGFDKVRVLKQYLGVFLAKPSEKLRGCLRDVDVTGHVLIFSKEYAPIITFLLVKQGRQNYRVFTSTQIIDIYLGKDELINSYRDVVDAVVIVVASKAEMENKRRWELIYQFAMERKMMGHGMIVISDEKCANLNEFKELGFQVVDMKENPVYAKGDAF